MSLDAILIRRSARVAKTGGYAVDGEEQRSANTTHGDSFFGLRVEIVTSCCRTSALQQVHLQHVERIEVRVSNLQRAAKYGKILQQGLTRDTLNRLDCPSVLVGDDVEYVMVLWVDQGLYMVLAMPRSVFERVISTLERNVRKKRHCSNIFIISSP